MMFYKETNFRETEIGRIPKEWEVVRLEDIGTLQYGITTSTKNEDTSIKFLRITDIKNDGMIDWLNVPHCEVSGSELEKYELKISDILFARIGATTGKTCYISQPIRGVFGSYLIRFQHVREKVHPKFLYYYTQSRIYWSQVNRIREGQLKKGLNLELLKNLRLPHPSPLEQQRIAEIFLTVDEAIQKTDEVIAKTERLKKGLMQELLTKGIGHKEFKYSGDLGCEIPKDWDIKRLEEASIEVTIGVVNPATPYYTSADDGVPYFRSQNVRENKLEPTGIFVTRGFRERHHKSILKENDVLTVQTGFIGTSCLVPKIYEGANCHSLLITRTNPRVLDSQFLCHFLSSATGKNVISKHNSGWGRAHLLLQDFRRIRIPLPPLREQQEIAKILSTVYRKLELERNEKARLEKIKQGLMELLLTGKIRIKVD